MKIERTKIIYALRTMKRKLPAKDELTNAEDRLWSTLRVHMAEEPMPIKGRFSFKMLQLAPAYRPYLASFLVVAILAGSGFAYWRYQGRSSSAPQAITDASGKRIPLAQGDFELTPSKEDSIGIDPSTTFTLASAKLPLSKDYLKKYLKVEPAADFDVTEESAGKAVVSFRQPLQSDTVYSFALVAPDSNTPEAKDDENVSWAYQVKNSFRVLQTLPRNHATSVPLNSGIEIRFSHENYADIDQLFSITPKVEGTFERHKETAVFVPKALKAGTIYTVTLKKGLTLEGSPETITADTIFQFQTTGTIVDSDAVRVSLSSSLVESSPSDAPVLGFQLYNAQKGVPDAAVEAYKFPSKDAFVTSLQQKDTQPWWTTGAEDLYHADTKGLEKVLSFGGKIEFSENTFSGYVVFPQSLSEGYYLVNAAIAGKTHQVWLQVTKTAAYITVSQTKTLVWAKDLLSGGAINGASIQVVGSQGAAAKTGSDGVATFDTPADMKVEATSRSALLDEGNGIHYLSISNPGSVDLVLPLSQVGDVYGYQINSGLFSRIMGNYKDRYWTYMYVDRSLYQPSDTIRYWGVVKDRDTNANQTGYRISLTGSSWQTIDGSPIAIAEKDLTVSSSGTYIGELETHNLRPGSYRITIRHGSDVVDSKDVEVQTYAKPAYQIKVQSDKKAAFAGDTITFSGTATFFEGTAVPNETLNCASCSGGVLTTGRDGGFSVPVTLPAPQGTTSIYSATGYYPDYRTFDLSPKLAEEGEIVAGTDYRVFALDTTVKTSHDAEGGKGRITFEANKIDISRLNNGTAKDGLDYIGAAADGLSLTGSYSTIQRVPHEVGQYYDFISKRTEKRYEYQTVNTYKGSVNVTMGSDGKAVFEYDRDPTMDYSFYLQGKDGRGTTFVMNLSQYRDYAGSPSSDNYTLEQAKSPENGEYGDPKYNVGEPVSMKMLAGEKALEPKDGGFLFEETMRGIQSYSVQKESSYGFTFNEKQIPNTYVQGVYFDGKTFHASNVASVIYDTKSRKLSVEVKPDKDAYVPADTTTLNVNVTDASGKGNEAEVNLNVVDQAYRAMVQNTETVDPLYALYGMVTSGVLETATSHLNPITADSGGGGGCFAAGTPVLMAGGERKPIEDIKKGDLIQTRESETSSKLVTATVSKTFEHTVGEYLLVNGSLRITPEHILLVDGVWMMAEDMQLGDRLVRDDGSMETVYSIQRQTGTFKVYNLEVERYHTFFAGGRYVHNSKGGERSLFPDVAYFGSIHTNSSGSGTTSFKLPDNLTQWNVTAQAINDNLQAGSGTGTINVRLPFFVDVVMNTTYVSGDVPTVKIRTFGESLKQGQDVNLVISSDTLSIGKTLTVKAFADTDLELPSLQNGQHTIKIEASAGSMKDALSRTISVVGTHIGKTEVKTYDVAADTKITGSSTGPTLLTFASKGRSAYYESLLSLATTAGDRVDERLARSEAQSLLAHYFKGSERTTDPFNGTTYQMSDGGIALYPYASSDPALSAKMAGLVSDQFDLAALANYFRSVRNDRKTNREQGIQAMYGLASLHQPTLLGALLASKATDLSVREQLYLGLTFAKMGDNMHARIIAKALREKYGEDLGTSARLKVGEDQGSSLEATALMAELSLALGEAQASSYFRYVVENKSADDLHVTELLGYLKEALPRLSDSEVSFSYTLGGKTTEKKLGIGETYAMQVSPQELQEIVFATGEGSGGVTASYDVPMDATARPVSSDLSVSRSYSIGGKKITEAKAGDLVKVTLEYSIGAQIPDGCVQISDYLPSGLRIVSAPYRQGLTTSDTKDLWYPYEVNGQKASFCAYKGKNTKPITYYARVVSKGDYVAESAVIQSQAAPTLYNRSAAGRFSIR